MDVQERTRTVARSVAYFSMEVGLESGIPTYSGGLGVLAGDTLRAAADLGVPMIGITLAHRGGYFHQRLDTSGVQTEEPERWLPEDRLTAAEPVVSVRIADRTVHLRAWRYNVSGYYGFVVPVYLLDADLPENAPDDRVLTDRLYGGDLRYRLCQEAVLGLGGVALLRALGHASISSYHMNEGHSVLLGLGLLEEEIRRVGSGAAALEAVRRRCVFTTHTPVPAGHDRFDEKLVREVLGSERTATLAEYGLLRDGELNMTHAALELSRYLNGVAMRHREVSRSMFPGYQVGAITNGVHAGTWVAPPLQELYDRYMPEWRADSFNLRYAIGIPAAEIRQAHTDAKRNLLEEVRRRTGRSLEADAFTIGFARRATTYKRAELVFSDLDRLRHIAREVGPVQLVFAGKAHPADQGGKALIRGVYAAAAELGDAVPVVYLENYDMDVARLLCSGVDLWLNTPRKPEEASGTSGMKAAMNGVPSLSVLDGWWVEGHVEGVTGWSIGRTWEVERERTEVSSLYSKLERKIVPLYYGRPEKYAEVRRAAIVLNGSFFHAERMVFQYAVNPYGLPAHARGAGQDWNAGRPGPQAAQHAG